MKPPLALILAMLACPLPLAGADDGMPFPGPPISATTARVAEGELLIGNNVITATFVRESAQIRLASVGSPLNGLDLKWSDPNLFTIFRTGGAPPLVSSAMKLVAGPEALAFAGKPGTARLADRLPGQLLRATFSDEASGLVVQWSAIMTAGANYLRQELKLRATRGAVGIDRIEMIHANLPGAQVSGYTDGSPVVSGKLFLGIEHPMARNHVETGAGWTPLEMRARRIDLPVTGLVAGECRVRFDYQRGNHRIEMAKVSLIGTDGKELATDEHLGFSGNAAQENVYRLSIPAGVVNASLRVDLGGQPGETDSWGNIMLEGATLAKPVAAVCDLPRQCVLEPGAEWTVSSGIGVYPEGQLRRAFLYYLERERAHPYRQYWHYNSWYDLNIERNDNPDPLVRMTEAQCLDVIEAFGRELHEKRGVGLDGFVWDDGWDDWNSLWKFHTGFPNGFAKLRQQAAKQGAGMGAWLSPWGGYGSSHESRVKLGRQQGYETNAGGFSLGGPKYYAAFRDVCIKMIREFNQNYFKFDGIGGGMYATGAPSSIAPDLDGLVRVLAELRQANPGVFINCTVGTWASPYWVWFADSVWRQGEDCAYVGEGNARERWITYRDERIYTRFAQPCPLYPLNSLMYHGLLVGNRGAPAAMPTPAQDIESYRHELNLSVACGSGLGELYVTHSLMTAEAWEILAAGLKWARAHRDMLRDTHWVGGNPLNEIYGYAAWHPVEGGSVVLRNPTGRRQTFVFNPQVVWELPAGARQTYRLTPALGTTSEVMETSVVRPVTLTLKPFEVQVWEASPQ